MDQGLPRNEKKEKAIEYAKEHNTDSSVIMTVAGAVNLKLDYDAFSKGGADMCTVFEETWAEGLAEGIIGAVRECGFPDGKILDMLQKKLNISLQEAQEYLDRYNEKYL